MCSIAYLSTTFAQHRRSPPVIRESWLHSVPVVDHQSEKKSFSWSENHPSHVPYTMSDLTREDSNPGSPSRRATFVILHAQSRCACSSSAISSRRLASAQLLRPVTSRLRLRSSSRQKRCTNFTDAGRVGKQISAISSKSRHALRTATPIADLVNESLRVTQCVLHGHCPGRRKVYSKFAHSLLTVISLATSNPCSLAALRRYNLYFDDWQSQWLG
ncbi:hypothetical protein CBOM_07873 [Ceraceosorus bombacis]|uniref:Uncharacterized protein n=1 Tax=Ceraceosorus bombacis TaxID=401625 RepID=A0A0P1BHM2_9BASI|nr:hypothetical protein CBOM_07873 [Ceraceosorus bombacis]